MGVLGGAIGGFAGGEIGGAVSDLVHGPCRGRKKCQRKKRQSRDLARGLGSAVGGVAGGLFEPFKNGGPVKGKRGAPKKALLHGGEYVLPAGVKPTMAQRKAVAQRKRKGKKPVRKQPVISRPIPPGGRRKKKN